MTTAPLLMSFYGVPSRQFSARPVVKGVQSRQIAVKPFRSAYSSKDRPVMIRRRFFEDARSESVYMGGFFRALSQAFSPVPKTVTKAVLTQVITKSADVKKTEAAKALLKDVQTGEKIANTALTVAAAATGVGLIAAPSLIKDIAKIFSPATPSAAAVPVQQAVMQAVPQQTFGDWLKTFLKTYFGL